MTQTDSWWACPICGGETRICRGKNVDTTRECTDCDWSVTLPTAEDVNVDSNSTWTSHGVEIVHDTIEENGVEVEGWRVSYDDVEAIGHGREEALCLLVERVTEAHPEFWLGRGAVIQERRSGQYHHVSQRLVNADTGERLYEITDGTHTRYWTSREEDLRVDYDPAGVRFSAKPAGVFGKLVNGILLGRNENPDWIEDIETTETTEQED